MDAKEINRRRELLVDAVYAICKKLARAGLKFESRQGFDANGSFDGSISWISPKPQDEAMKPRMLLFQTMDDGAIMVGTKTKEEATDENIIVHTVEELLAPEGAFKVIKAYVQS